MTAIGGSAGAGGAQGGDATANATGVGGRYPEVSATADGGTGTMIAGRANANAEAESGGISTATAQTQTGLAPGSLIISAAGYAQAALGVQATASSWATIGTSTLFTVAPEAVSIVTAAPSAAAVAGVLSVDPQTAAAVGTNSNVFALGELGGVSSVTTTADITLDTLLLGAQQDLILSLYRPIYISNSYNYGSPTDISFSLSANGTTLVSQEFTSVGAAGAWFADHPMNLGALPEAASVDLHLALSVDDLSGGGKSFYGGFLLAAQPAH